MTIAGVGRLVLVLAKSGGVKSAADQARVGEDHQFAQLDRVVLESVVIQHDIRLNLEPCLVLYTQNVGDRVLDDQRVATENPLSPVGSVDTLSVANNAQNG